MKVKNGNWENKFLIYNEMAIEGEPFIVAIFKDMYAFCMFFYIVKIEGRYVVKDKRFDEIEIGNTEEFLNNLQEYNVNLDVPEFVNLKKYYQYLLYEDKEQKYSLFPNPKTGKIVKIDIKDEKYFPAEDLKIDDCLTKEKMEKYEIYYDEDDEGVWLSEVIKNLVIVTEIIGKYPNQKEKIVRYIWFDYKFYV